MSEAYTLVYGWNFSISFVSIDVALKLNQKLSLLHDDNLK